MLERRHHEEPGKELPGEWSENVQQVLTQTFGQELIDGEKKFHVSTRLFSDELLLCVGLIPLDHHLPEATTLKISCDLDESSRPEKMVDTLIDSVGTFFDSYLANDEWTEYSPVWTETKVNKMAFYYQVSRENLFLTELADRLLSSGGGGTTFQ